MTGGSHIRAVGQESAQAEDAQLASDANHDVVELEDEWVDGYEEPARQRRWTDWIAPTIAILAMAGWSAFFAWTFQQTILARPGPQDWVVLLVNWSVPMLLITCLFMLSMRLSRREANRFGDAAKLLRQEAEALESRLAVFNRELSLAREFLGSQSRDLDSLGRIAGERISTHAAQLQSLIQSNGAQVEAIASVSDTALINMGKLRDDLPVIATSARDVSNQIGQAGRTAHDQIEKLVSGFERLNQFGQASSRQITALSSEIGDTLGLFESRLSQVEDIAEKRFAEMASKSEAFIVELDGREVEASSAMRARAEELRASVLALGVELDSHAKGRAEAFAQQITQLKRESETVAAEIQSAQAGAIGGLEEHRDRLFSEVAKVVGKIDQLDQHAVAAARRRVAALEEELASFDQSLLARDAQSSERIGQRQDEFDLREAQASEVLAQRLSELDELLAERTQAQVAQLEKLVSHGTEVSAKVSELNGLLTSVSEHTEHAEEVLSDGLANVAGAFDKSRADLATTGATLAELTESGIRLLEIIQSGARESREALPHAISQASDVLSDVETRAALLKDTVDAARQSGGDLSDYVIAASDSLKQADASIAEINVRISEGTAQGLEQVANMRKALADVEQESERASTRASEELRAAILQLEEAANHAFGAIEQGANERLASLAEEIASKAGSAIEQSLRDEGQHAVERIEQANLRASASGKEVTASLRDQLAKVNQLASNLEQRVARAREQAQEQIDNDFARRMALITESLNSNAIDIAKVLSHDVTDTAWASYLKGDRGIFTLRAVRLIDNSEAREIMELYEADDSFREHVSRYIHDFEGMLRSVLSTRDGNAMGVTLLSSDMGKLYVALAQSIERLRD